MNAGGILIESIVYMVCTTLLYFIFLIFMYNYYQNLKLSLINTRSSLDLIISMDNMAQQIKYSNLVNSIKLEQTEFIYSISNETKQINRCLFKSNNIYKILGNYVEGYKYTNKAKSLVVKNINNLLFKYVYNKNNSLKAINFIITKSKNYEIFVALRSNQKI